MLPANAHAMASTVTLVNELVNISCSTLPLVVVHSHGTVVGFVTQASEAAAYASLEGACGSKSCVRSSLPHLLALYLIKLRREH
jgi:hypothetical protein